MKIPKVLLSAIAVAVAVQATTSCGSKKQDPAPKTAQPGNCPACGLG